MAAVGSAVAQVQTGTSSALGIVVSADGDILVAGTSVEDADDSGVSVTFADGSTSQAALVGTDPRSGLALVRADSGPDLAGVSFADDDVTEGDEVLVLGPEAASNPPLSGTVADPTVASNAVSVIRFEAAKPLPIGGSVLVNQGGQVLGIVTGTVVGVEDGPGDTATGLAVPAELASRVTAQLLDGGAVAHPYLGVSIDDAPDGGASVRQVSPGSPAERAGLRTGDVITLLGGHQVTDAADVLAAVQSGQVGERVTATVMRAGSDQELAVTLGQAPPADGAGQ